MKYILSLAITMVYCTILSQGEQLIVLTQSSDKIFREETLPQLNSFASQEGIQVFEFDAREGLPESITSTPAILFRNDKGISTYAGRYTSMTTIKNFVRSARVIPHKKTTLNKDNTLLQRDGKMQIAASIKITELQYSTAAISQSVSSEPLLQMANQGIEKGLQGFQLKELIQLQRTDRIFYLDFHPYFVNNDSIILSVALYSQFSCIDPIYESVNQKIHGTNIAEVFRQAGIILKKEIVKSLSSSTIGDAYSSIGANVPVRELNEFDLPAITSLKNTISTIIPDQSIPHKWKFKSAVNSKLPILQFNFMEPLTRYTGEIKTINGTVNLDTENKLIFGIFEATMKSLTMGEESFDKKVLKEYVKARSNPKSEFITDQIINSTPLEWLKTSNLTINGYMELMKMKRPITVTADLRPYINEEGEAVLLVQANWSMNITDDWNIKGPDGPDPAKKTLEFSMNVLMQPIK